MMSRLDKDFVAHQVFLGHSDDARVGADHEHAEVGCVARHPEHGRLEVLLVPSQVDECDHL